MARRRVYKIRKRKKNRRKLLLFLVPLFILGLGASAYAASIYVKAKSVMDDSYKSIGTSDKRKTAVNPMADNVSILFIGVDDSTKRKFNGHARSDALMLATFNKKEKSIKLLSIPRDSYVYIPGKDRYTKINAAHAYGGPKTTIQTVEHLLDVPVDYYVRMNFNAFIDVVDALNGIDVDVPYDLREQDSKDHKAAIHLKPGMQTLDGEQALALARTRHHDSDIQRGERQQQILKAIMTKATSVGAVTKYTDVIQAVGNNMETNLKFTEMKSFLSYVTSGAGLNIETIKLKGADNYTDGIYYYKLDEASVEEVKAALQKHLNVTSKDDTNGSADSSSY
ncbi:LCP family protein [Actinomycetes bacterium NPDC127524]